MPRLRQVVLQQLTQAVPNKTDTSFLSLCEQETQTHSGSLHTVKCYKNWYPDCTELTNYFGNEYAVYELEN